MPNYWFFALSLVLTWLTATARKNDIYESSTKAGYVSEPHYVTTRDGYILTVFRIKVPSDDFADLAKKEPVILQHGLSGSAEHFTVAGNESLAFYLANHGYDVWVGNTRGSVYSRNHTTLNPDSKEFWEFTLDQHGKYDLPAMLEYILNLTSRSAISHIGHSQGSGMFFAMSAESPEHNNKVKLHIGLAPAVYTSNNKRQFSDFVGSHVPKIREICESIHFYEIPATANHPMIRSIIEFLCSAMNPFRLEICYTLVTVEEPVDHRATSLDTVSVLTSTQPAGTGVHQLLHYAQLTHTDIFGRYNWDPKRNLKYHNSTTAKPYNLTKVTPPIALFYGKNDGLVLPTNVARLSNELPNVVEYQAIADDFFSHVDFVVGKNLNILLNEPILAVLNKFSD